MEQTSFHVRLAVRGDTRGIEWIVTHFSSLVEAQVRLRLGPNASSHDVEDLAADVWLTTLQKLGDLEQRDGRLAGVVCRVPRATRA